MSVKIIESKDYEFLLDLAVKTEIEEKYYLEKSLNESAYKVWDVYRNDKRIGVVFSCFIDGIYTLDGYNDSGRFIDAVIAGKLACAELFKVTDVIWTAHLISMKRVTLLAEKIGFKKEKIMDEYILFRKERIWG